MSELRQQLQKHYDAQALPAAKVDAILADGRSAAQGAEKMIELPKRRAQLWGAAWAIAAAVVLLAGLSVWLMPGRPQVSYALLAPRVVDLFRAGPELPKRSQNPEELRTWLLAQGAPPDFQIPAKLRTLKSFGCQVVDVHGRPAYLTCFWVEKKPGVDDGELVHLLVAHRKDFTDGPPEGVPQFHTEGEWSFAAWSAGDVIYTMAAKAPIEKLQKFVELEHLSKPISANQLPSLLNSPRTAAWVRISGSRMGSALPPG